MKLELCPYSFVICHVHHHPHLLLPPHLYSMTPTMIVSTQFGTRILNGWQRGRNGGWCLIGCPMNDNLKDEPFTIGPMVIDMIADTDQNENVDIILNGKVASVWVMSSSVFGHCLKVYFCVGLFICKYILLCIKWGRCFQLWLIEYDYLFTNLFLLLLPCNK